MKRLVLTVMLLAMASALFAQSTNETWNNDLWGSASFENEATAGTFSNEIDKAFNPNPDFGLYSQQFIYGGLGNPSKLHSQGSLPAANPEIAFGYYRPGSMPMSYYGTFSGVANTNMPNSKFTTTWTDDTHSTISSTTKKSYTKVPLFDKYNGTFRFLIGIGKDKKMVTGFYFNMNGEPTGYNSANFEKTKYTDKINDNNSYTESKSSVAAVPAITNLNYKDGIAGLATFKNKFSIGVPLVMNTGALSHIVKFDLSGYIENKNAAYKMTSKAQNINYSYTGYNSNVALTANYTLETPVKDKEEDVWFAGATIGMDFRNKQYKYKYEHKEDEVTANVNKTSSPKMGFILKVNGGRLFNFTTPKKALNFRIMPQLTLGMDTRMTSTDLEGYNDKIKASYSNKKAVGAGQVKTESYTKTDKNGFHSNSTILTTEVKVPMGLKVLPENWKIGFLLGADLSATYSVTITRNTKDNHKQNYSETTSTTMGDGSTNNVNNSSSTHPGNTYTSQGAISNNKLTFNEKHYIGFTIPFEGGAHLDFFMDGSWLIKVDNFRIQAFIPLGTPKEKAKK